MNKLIAASLVTSLVFLNACAIVSGPTQDIGELSESSVLIAHLRSPSEEHRVKASNLLSMRGDKLDKSQVDKIIKIMRHGKNEWSRFLYRESHCRWFEYTTVKYYAADSLMNMESPYVTDKIVSQARKTKSKAKTTRRVTDPGWICY